MIKKTELIQIINSDEKIQADILSACKEIIDYICSVSNKNALEYIPYYYLCDKASSSPEVVLKSIYYLTQKEISLFEIKFEFIEGDYEPFQVSNEYIIDARITQEFISPNTGLPVQDYKKKLFTYFSLSDFGKEIVCD
ncbi:hypothetical protein RHO13_10345 [Orbus wheelerorum]|uniref:hypothetical protein n=1 Tax=Orbus wheelerorum TaxID=3074111 RepID=UPI00370DCF8D